MFGWLINEAEAASRLAADATGTAMTSGDIAVIVMGWPGLVIGMVLGMATLSVSYGITLYYVLRERFLIWHTIRNLTLVVMTLTIWPAPLGSSEALAFGSDLRNNLGVGSFMVAVALQNLFLRDFIEPRRLADRMRRAISWSATAFCASAVILFLPIPNAAKLVFIVTSGILCSTVQGRVFSKAMAGGSRSVRFVILGIVPISLLVTFCTIRWLLLGSTGGYVLLLGGCALMFEIFATAMGISDRFFDLRMQRDRALKGQARAQHQAQTDALTGLANRRGLEQRFAERQGRICAIAIVDLDHFKSFNDNFGHDVGDDVLRIAASALVHPDAFAARLGGEEFVLLFETDPAERIAEEIRQNISRLVAADLPRLPTRVTASIGFMRIGEGTGLNDALKAADVALYSAKANGRDRIMASEPLSGGLGDLAARTG